MIKSQVAAIVLLTPRANSTPRLAALDPQLELLDKDGFQTYPPGFNVIWLPYAGDIRTNIPYPPPNISSNVSHTSPLQPPLSSKDSSNTNSIGSSSTKASTEDIVLAKKFVKKLRIAFNSSNFENPALQKHYANLQALALDRETQEELVDFLQPDEEGMQRYSDLVLDYKKEIFPANYDPDVKKTPGQKQNQSKKRSREDEGEAEENIDNTKNSEPQAKRRKVTSISVDNIDWQQLAQSQRLASLSVPHLKGYCIKHNIKNYSKLKKAELVELVGNHITSTS